MCFCLAQKLVVDYKEYVVGTDDCRIFAMRLVENIVIRFNWMQFLSMRAVIPFGRILLRCLAKEMVKSTVMVVVMMLLESLR